MKPPVSAPEMPSGVRMIRLMAVVSLICGLLIVTAHLWTLEPIRRNQEILTAATVALLLPGMQRQVVYQVTPTGKLEIVRDAATQGPRVFAGYDARGALIGVVMEAAGRGWADTIKAMYAWSPDKQAIIGFKVTEMKETPGLGDKIMTDPAFLANFTHLEAKLDPTGKRVVHPIVTVKHGAKKHAWEIDAISGATVSSRAVGKMLEKSTAEMLPILAAHQDRLRKGE